VLLNKEADGTLLHSRPNMYVNIFIISATLAIIEVS